MGRGQCKRHGPGRPCTCAMGNIYRFVEPVALFLLKKKGRSYGYELSGALKEHALTDAEIERAALYRTLRRLETNGYVVSEWDVRDSGPPRRVYELTKSGEEHLNEWIEILDNLANSINRFVIDARALEAK